MGCVTNYLTLKETAHKSDRKAEFLLFIKYETLRNLRIASKHREYEPAGEWTSQSKWVQYKKSLRNCACSMGKYIELGFSCRLTKVLVNF